MIDTTCYNLRSERIAKVVFFSNVCLSVCLFVNAITFEPFEISSRNFFMGQNMFKSSDEFKSGCILMHCDVLDKSFIQF